MASPAAMGGASMGLQAIGGIVSGIGAKQSADASASAYRYKAQVAMFNKQINEQNARWALDAGETSSMESGLKSRQEIANTKVVQAASGFEVGGGTAEAVRDTQQEVAAFDQNVIRWDAKKTAYGYDVKAQTNEAEANLDTMAAKGAEDAGTIGMITSFLGAASGVADKWTKGQTIGLWG